MIDKNRIIPEHSLEANYLKLQCFAGEQPDQISLRVIRNDLPDFLLPIHKMNINGCTELRYTLGNQTALEYMNWTMSKQHFLEFYIKLMEPFMEGGDWMMDYHCLCVDMQYVFAERSGKSVKYMYIPLESCRNSDEDILQFFKGILDRVTVEGGSDFLVRLYQTFSRGNITLKELYHMVQKEMDESKAAPAVEPGYTPPVRKEEPQPLKPEKKETEFRPLPSDPFPEKESMDSKPGIFHGFGKKSGKKDMQEGKKDKKEIKNKKGKLEIENREIGFDAGGQDEVVHALFGTVEKKSGKNEKKGGLFDGFRKQKPTEQMPGRSGALLQDDSHEGIYREAEIKNYEYTQIEGEGDVTQIEGEYIRNESNYLEYVNGRVPGIPERIELDFQGDRITIGRSSKDARQADITFGAEHRRVGRMHACIQKKNEHYYIVDLGSANATMLNRQILVPNQPYLLHNQDVIGFVASQPIEYRVVFSVNGRML